MRPMRVLIVEDEWDLRDRLVELLSRQGMLVDGVACLDEAIAALPTTSFDLLLVDRALPDGDGLSPPARPSAGRTASAASDRADRSGRHGRHRPRPGRRCRRLPEQTLRAGRASRAHPGSR